MFGRIIKTIRATGRTRRKQKTDPLFFYHIVSKCGPQIRLRQEGLFTFLKVEGDHLTDIIKDIGYYVNVYCKNVNSCAKLHTVVLHRISCNKR